MPTYVRFLKDILTKKRKLGDYETVAMTKAYNVILTSKIPTNMKDPRSFTIPVFIGAQKIGLALYKEVPIILGRPFFSTGRALVDVHKGELTMHMQDQEMKFSVHDYMKFPAESEECTVLKILDEALMEE
ncbi:uncharacterized protein LOC111013376 [Momordica charantia]|uniref:Uncharacterized protein LOC111013376 n=1 Tax=Momordica charantia TaxID=3673 RepID=A0A6J1CPH5_MOMCH|nr:uncharacterized protein LOC111013376 [Momordica charantia]